MVSTEEVHLSRVLDNYALSNSDAHRTLGAIMNVLKKIIRFPIVVCKAFWEVLKYIWENKARLLVPFLLGEATYWAPFVAVCILSIIYNNYAWATAFYGFYVGVLPAIPIQITLTFGYYALMLKLGKKENAGIKDECQKLIDRIKKIS